jgi:hypothetical protein
MRKLMIVGLVIAGALVGAAALAALPDEPPRGVTFKEGSYTLIVTELNALNNLNFAEPKKTKQTISLEGALQTPPGRDVVAVKGPLKILEVVDDAGTNVLAPTRRRPSRTYKTGTYVPVNQATSCGEVELQNTTLTANAYTIRSMTVETEVIMAKKRASKRLNAVVMKEPVDVIAGLAIRISGVKLSTKGELTVTAEYVRPRAGPGGPFLEAVYVLDAEEKKIGGGRWTDGDPFGTKGKITAHLQLERGTEHKILRFVAVTEDESKMLTFKLTKVFQK